MRANKRERATEESVAESLAFLSRDVNTNEMIRSNDNNIDANSADVLDGENENEKDEPVYDLWINKLKDDKTAYDLAKKGLQRAKKEIGDLNAKLVDINTKLNKVLKTLNFHDKNVQTTGNIFRETYTVCKCEFKSFDETLPIELQSQSVESSTSAVIVSSNITVNNSINVNSDDKLYKSDLYESQTNTHNTVQDDKTPRRNPLNIDLTNVTQSSLHSSSSSSTLHENSKVLKARGIYTIACGFRVQLRKHNVSKNTKSFVDALWLHEMMVCMFSKFDTLLDITQEGNYEYMKYQSYCNNKDEYYYLLGSYIRRFCGNGKLDTEEKEKVCIAFNNLKTLNGKSLSSDNKDILSIADWSP